MAIIISFPSNWDSTADDSMGIGGAWDKGAQSFTISTYNCDLESVDIPVSGGNPVFPPGITTMEIYAVDGSGFPTGEVLSTGSYDLTGASFESPPEVIQTRSINIPMSVVTLSANTQYALVVIPPVGNYAVAWYGFTSGFYSGGKPMHHVDGGAWENATALGDLAFRINGTTQTTGKAITPTPEDAATGQSLQLTTLSWENGTPVADTFDIYFGLTDNLLLISTGQVDLSVDVPYLLSWNTEYSWRVDSISDLGTTVGDTWSFTTVVLLPPEDRLTYKRLVAAAQNKFYYEDI